MGTTESTSWRDITKEEFDDAYNTYPPNAWFRWTYKYFSKDSEQKQFSPSWIVTAVLITSFLLGFFGTVFNAPRAFIATATWILVIMLVLVCFNILFVAWGNNLRLRKVRKLLGLTRQEYEWVVDKYYP